MYVVFFVERSEDGHKIVTDTGTGQNRGLALISKAAIFKTLLLIIGLASKNQFGVPVISVNSGLRPSTSVLVFGPFNT